nr:putative uncharacterized protein DDB_G0286901 [Maniola hyperantus]
MMWKIVIVCSVALCVQGEEDAISEQRVVIHHRKSFRSGSHSHNELNKSGNQDEYAQAYPSYEFSYKVNDPKTHDIKGQHETREGDEVTGNYWLIEPSGRKRTVKYQANDDSGFNAQIAYTASLKGKETDEDESVSQSKSKEKDNIEENNEEGVEISVGEEIQDVQDSNDEVEENREPAPVEENNASEQNELDSQKDEANNINNVDRNDDGNLAQSINIFENESNRENNERNLSKSRRGNSDAEKGLHENSKRNKNHERVRHGNESNKNNRERPKHTKRVKQDGLKQNNNNNKNRNVHREKKVNRHRNLHNQEKIYNDDSNVTVNKGLIEADQEQNERKQYEFRKGRINNNEENYNRNNKNYAYTNRTPSEEVHRKIDAPNKEETFEHRIRIYHPKIISPISKEERRKH